MATAQTTKAETTLQDEIKNLNCNLLKNCPVEQATAGKNQPSH